MVEDSRSLNPRKEGFVEDVVDSTDDKRGPINPPTPVIGMGPSSRTLEQRFDSMVVALGELYKVVEVRTPHALGTSIRPD